MNWSTIETALKSVIQSCSEITDVSWSTDQNAVHDLSMITLTRRNLANVFEEHERYEMVDNVPTLKIVGNRTFVLEVRAETAYTTPERASDILTLVRIKLRRPSIQDALYAANISIASIGNIFAGDYVSDNRIVDAAFMEIKFNTVDQYEDTEFDIIEHIEAKNAGTNETLTVDKR